MNRDDSRSQKPSGPVQPQVGQKKGQSPTGAFRLEIFCNNGVKLTPLLQKISAENAVARSSRALEGPCPQVFDFTCSATAGKAKNLPVLSNLRSAPKKAKARLERFASKSFATMGLTFVAAILSIVVSCGTARKATQHVQDPAPQAAANAPDVYKQAMHHLEQEKFADAFASFEEFLSRNPASPYTQVAVFNSARALEGLNRWNEAVERYRSVMKNTDRAPFLQALAIYRISFCHEALGNDSQTVAALVDAQRRSTDLPEEIAVAELPARLAAAYARVGAVDEAIRFYNRAESGVSRLRSRGGKGSDLPEWLPRTLYFMGRMSLRQISWEAFEITLRPVGKAQLYLLQAAELEYGTWSEKATKELIQVYESVWSVLQNIPAADSEEGILQRREAQKRQLELAALTMNSLRELRAARSPTTKDGSEHVKAIFAFVDRLEENISQLIEEPPAGSGLTPEAKARRERVRGKVVDPTESLEQAYVKARQERSRPLPEKTKIKTKAPASPAPDLKTEELKPENSNSEISNKDEPKADVEKMKDVGEDPNL